jgi:hypothetical protein
MQKEYRIAGGASLQGSGRAALDADEIVAAALKRSGRREFSDRSFLLPLKRLIAACNAEGNLSTFGRRAVRFDVLRGMKNILELDAIEEEQPGVRSRPLERPIFITGMPRSGTTFLHRLLLQERTVAAPRVWQLVYPYLARRGRLGAHLCRLWVGAQLQLMHLLAPSMRRRSARISRRRFSRVCVMRTPTAYRPTGAGSTATAIAMPTGFTAAFCSTSTPRCPGGAGS